MFMGYIWKVLTMWCKWMLIIQASGQEINQIMITYLSYVMKWVYNIPTPPFKYDFMTIYNQNQDKSAPRVYIASVDHVVQVYSNYLGQWVGN